MQYRGAGADRCARELYEDLPAQGVESSMWVSERRPADPPEILGLKRAWERFVAPLEAFPDLTDWRHRGSISFLNSISHRDFDLVHIHNIHSGSFSIKAVRELTNRFPCVWTLHDEWAPKLGLTYDLTGKISPARVKELSRGPIRYIPYHRYHENYKWRRTRDFLREWLPQPRFVICPSRYMADLANESGVFPRSGIVHIPNGTRMCDIAGAHIDRAKARHGLGLDPNRPVVLMISADLAQAHKGIDLGIAALRAVRAPWQPQLLLLGPSGTTVAKNIAPLEAICISISDDDALARAYRAADLTVIPSLGENFPYVGLESLACETPIVSFAIGGMSELTGANERGFACETLDPAEMARHIEFLLSNASARNKMGQAGASWVRNVCGMSGYLKSVVRTYQEALYDRGNGYIRN
jgi:glycosyltransferase involved in cell wall biosynthesis